MNLVCQIKSTDIKELQAGVKHAKHKVLIPY